MEGEEGEEELSVPNVVVTPTVLEELIMEDIPEVQVVERIQEQNLVARKTIPQERGQQRTVEQIANVPVP